MFLRMQFLPAALLAMAGFGAPARAALPPTMLQPARVSPMNSDEPFAKGVTCGDVERQARLLTPHVVVGEPVVMEILLTGRPFVRDKAEFNGRMEVGRDLHVWVKPPRGAHYEIVPPSSAGFSPQLSYELDEGETVSATIILAYDQLSPNGAFAFDEGTFGLLVTIDCPPAPGTRETGGPRTIGEMILHVDQPGAGDAVALSLLKKPKDFITIQGLRAGSQESRDLMQQIVDDAPGSRLRPYAMAAIGNHWYLDGIDKQGDPKHLEDAVRELERFRAEYPDHPLSHQIELRLMKAYAYSNHEDVARKLFTEMWSDPATTKLLRTKEEMRRWFFGEPEPDIAGPWMIFANPADALKPDSADVEKASDPNTPEGAVQDAIRRAMQGEGTPRRQ